MSASKKKRNHWVPQAYLRSFAADPGRNKIWTMGIDAGEPRLRPIEKVAVKFYLYAPAGPQGRDYSFEDTLASLEQWFGEPYWNAAATGIVDLMHEPTRKMLALLAATMYLRHPLHLEMMKNIHRQMVDFLSQPLGLPDEVEINGRVIEVDKSSWPAYRDGGEDDIKRMWLKEVGRAGWLAKIFLEMRWAVILAEEPTFITTDNPVTPIHSDMQFHGFRNPGTSVMFPLSPTRLLWLDHRRSEPDGQYYPLKDNGGGMNTLLWRNALRDMFSDRDPHYTCADIVDAAESMGFS